MKPYRYRQLIRDIERVCEAHGVEVTRRSGGRGSHESLRFTEKANGRHVHVTIVRGKEVSPGVQHGILSSLIARYAVHEAVRDLADLVRDLLHELFNNNL